MQAKLVEEGARSHAQTTEEYYHAERDYTRAQHTVEEIEVRPGLVGHRHATWTNLMLLCFVATHQVLHAELLPCSCHACQRMVIWCIYLGWTMRSLFTM